MLSVQVLEQAAPPDESSTTRKRTPEELEAFLDRMANGSETLPVIATACNSRSV